MPAQTSTLRLTQGEPHPMLQERGGLRGVSPMICGKSSQGLEEGVSPRTRAAELRSTQG